MTDQTQSHASGFAEHSLAGCEWVVDVHDCPSEGLASLNTMRQVCEQIIDELGLTVVGQPLWHQFPGPGGVTGLYLLSESHLACHTWPETGTATFNLFCCRRRREWPWESRLSTLLNAGRVTVRVLERGEVADLSLAAHSAGGVL